MTCCGLYSEMKRLSSYPLLLAGLLQLSPYWRTISPSVAPSSGSMLAIIRSILVFSGVVGSLDAVSGASVTIAVKTFQAKAGVSTNFTIVINSPADYTVNKVVWAPISPAGTLPPGLSLVTQKIPGFTILSAKISGTPTSPGTYLVRITAAETNRSGGIDFQVTGTNTVVVAPPDLPATIATPPMDQTVRVGNSVSWTVVASGSDPILYQWYFNATNALKGATNAMFDIANVALNDDGRYSVAVTNKFGGQLSSEALLTVLPNVVVPPFALEAPQIDSGNVRFSLPTVAGASYTVWSISALAGSTWQMMTNLPVQTGPGPLNIQLPIMDAQRWYRVTSTP